MRHARLQIHSSAIASVQFMEKRCRCVTELRVLFQTWPNIARLQVCGPRVYTGEPTHEWVVRPFVVPPLGGCPPCFLFQNRLKAGLQTNLTWF